MTQSTRQLFYTCFVLVFAAAFVFPVMGQPINVTFRANLATNPDTITAANGFVQVRGALNGSEGAILPGGVNISWSNTSDLIMSSDGGDYWSITFQMEPDDTLRYKFWTGFDDQTGTFFNTGWESDLNPTNGLDSGNRAFISGSTDTTVQLQFYNATGQTQDQLWMPYEMKPDSIAIYFRVNMGGQTQIGNFDPATTDTVGIRGSAPIGDVGWSASKIALLTRENGSAIDSSFWSGVAYVDKDSVNVNDEQQYKFVFVKGGATGWEDNVSNRTFTFTNSLVNTSMDTTLSWVWFDNLAYSPSAPVTANFTFRVSTEAVEGLGLFDRGVGDKIYVIGPNGFNLPNPPYSGTGDLIEMNYVPVLEEWTAVEQFTKIPGTDINYKYFIRWDSTRVNPNSPNYIPNLDIRYLTDDNIDSGWEEPSSTGGGNRIWTWTTDPDQHAAGDWGFERQFFNGAPANCWFDNPMAISFSVNMQPATDALQNTNPHLFDPAADSVWIQFDGSLFALSQGWPTFAYRDIVLEDPDQDMVYTVTYTVDPPGWYQLGFVIAYGNSTDGYITNGGGTETGRRYYQFVHPDSLLDEGGQFPQAYWPSSYDLPQLDWVQSHLPFEQPPDMTTPVGIADNDNLVPGKFALYQNYPNPFNPSTTIQYELAKTAEVNITIYNVTGQKVKTIVNEKQVAGKHAIIWDGRNFAYNKVASGIYFVKMKAGDFNRTRKIVMLK